MAIPSWIEDSDFWDEIYVGDAFFDETKVDVEGVPFGNDVDIKKGSGLDGAKTTDKGYTPWQPKLSIVLYTQFHWEQYQVLLALYQPKPGRQGTKVVRIAHPIFDLYKKNRFKLLKIYPLKYLGQSQWVAEFDLLEHFDTPKPKPKVDPPATRPERESLLYEQNKPSANPKP